MSHSVGSSYLGRGPAARCLRSALSSPRPWLCPTPPEKLADARGRPYFLWDEDLSLAEFRERLASPGAGDYWLATLLRQAKPDDVYGFVSLPEIAERWDDQ